jgi:hypothetical protein
MGEAMNKYKICVATTHVYGAEAEFNTEDEAYAWAEQQGGEVILDESSDWSFDDGTFEVIGVDLADEDE